MDVLPRESYETGHIPGAVNIPSDGISQGASDMLDKDGAMHLSLRSASPNTTEGAATVLASTCMASSDAIRMGTNTKMKAIGLNNLAGRGWF